MGSKHGRDFIGARLVDVGVMAGQWALPFNDIVSLGGLSSPAMPTFDHEQSVATERA